MSIEELLSRARVGVARSGDVKVLAAEVDRLRRPEFTDDERAELIRQLRTAEIMAASGPLGPITPTEAEQYGWSPEDVAEFNADWSAAQEEADHAHRQVRLSLLQKLAALAGVK